jgi:predicted MPP superfamily phosphohydrolase
MATVRLHIETVQTTAVGGDLALQKDRFKQASLTSMRIITYSELHLEFGSGWLLPPAVNGDVMILAGDIITLRDYEPLDQILRKWEKPVLYVTGNHEYYTRRPMNEEDNRFTAWLGDRHPHVKLLLDEEVSID